MKIAIAVSGTEVSGHFGSAEAIRIFTLDPGGQVTETEIIQGSDGCGCRSGIADVLANRDVKILLAGNMGRGAYTLLRRNQIVVLRGCSGEVMAVLNDFLDGSLSDQESSCTEHAGHRHHHEGHVCNHHHQ